MNKKYELIIYWSQDDGAYVDEVPELPGGMVDRQTCGEAVENAQTTIDEWIETAKELGRETPEPKGRLLSA